MSEETQLPVDPTTLPISFNFATDIVDHWAKCSPPRLAMHWIDQSMSVERKLTYSHFSTQSHRIAALMASFGLKQGEACIIILPRIPEWWECATACLRAGIVMCPCTTLLVDKDIEHRLQASNAAAFIGDEVSVSKVLKVRRKCPSLRIVIQVGGTPSPDPTVVSLHSALFAISPATHFQTPPPLKPTSHGLAFFTSGTTGPPKMVLHSQISYPLAHALTGVHWLKLNSSSVYWNLSEQGWAKAAWSFFATWNCGAALFIHDDRQAFDPRRTLSVLARFPITTLCAPPTAYRQLVSDDYRQLYQAEGMKTLRHACGAGEPLNASVIGKWKELTGGMEIYDGYGQTETILTCANQANNPIRYGSMGKPIPGVPLAVIDADGHETPIGVEGDIALMVEGGDGDGFFGMFLGYIDTKTGRLDRRLTTSAQGRQYYLTGDRATRDRDGYFWFVGRNDDVINSSGYRIGPFEVESTLKFHPAILESAVVASPDPQREEVVKAFIVLTPSAAKEVAESPSIRDALVKEVQDFCKEHAAPYKYPRKVEFVDMSFLPKTISGKIKRADLKKLEKERYAEARAAKL